MPGELKKVLDGGGEGFFAVVGGLLLLPLAALAGAVCEGLTDIVVRPLVKWIAERSTWIKILFQASAQETYDFWLGAFKAAAQGSALLEGFPTSKNTHGIAVGLLYDSGQEESINWAESHYSTYILVTNFALLALSAEIYLVLYKFFGSLSWPDFGLSTLCIMGVFYSCLSLSLHRYLYSYQVALRQAAVTLLREAKPVEPVQGRGESSGQKSQVVDAQPRRSTGRLRRR